MLVASPKEGVIRLASQPRSGPPRFYVEQGVGNMVLVRATATGAVTAAVRCPAPKSEVAFEGIAATENRAFFIVCVKIIGQGSKRTIAERIYRFGVTDSGRISGYSLVPGGALHGLQVGVIAAAPGGSRVAVSVEPAAAHGAQLLGSEKIIIINARTGASTIWQPGPARPGRNTFAIAALSWVGNGRELRFLARCVHLPVKNNPRCRGTDVQLGTISAAAGGGRLTGRTLLVRQVTGFVNDTAISPSGSKLLLVAVHSASARGSASVTVTQFSASTGRKLRVFTGNGFLYRFFNSDPTGRFLLLDVGPSAGSVNGWIDQGSLIRLKPAGSGVFYEAW